MLVVQKTIRLRLFYVKGTRQHYVLMNNSLYPIKERLAHVISNNEELEIVETEDQKAMQIICNENK